MVFFRKDFSKLLTTYGSRHNDDLDLFFFFRKINLIFCCLFVIFQFQYYLKYLEVVVFVVFLILYVYFEGDLINNHNNNNNISKKRYV